MKYNSLNFKTDLYETLHFAKFGKLISELAF